MLALWVWLGGFGAATGAHGFGQQQFALHWLSLRTLSIRQLLGKSLQHIEAGRADKAWASPPLSRNPVSRSARKSD